MDSRDGAPPTLDPIPMPSSLFEHLPHALPVLHNYEIRQKLLQWHLSDTLHLHRFLVHRRLPVEADEALIAEFFQADNVHQILPLPTHLASYASNETPSKPGGASALNVERLRVSVTSMAFFEKLESAGIVAHDGSVRGCMDEVFDGCSAGDLLTEMRANPDSNNCDVFSAKEQQEFIFQLFFALVIGGGALRQADVQVQAYEDMTRTLYRALVSVKKSNADAYDTRDIEITSRVYRTLGSVGSPSGIAPFEHRGN